MPEDATPAAHEHGAEPWSEPDAVNSPAAPGDFTNAVDSMATTLEDLGISYLAGAPAFAQDQIGCGLGSQISDVNRLCR
jgi:hypothetical protein